MKRIALLCIVLALIACAFQGCSNREPNIAPQPRYDAEATDGASQTEFGETPAYEIVGSVARFFAGNAGGRLYGAVEYKNMGDCPMVVSSAAFLFMLDGSESKHEFEPAAYKKHVTYPGETAYIVAWVDYKLDEPTRLTLESATLTCEKSEPERVVLEVSDVFLVQNYPLFATVSGEVSLKEAESCALNLIYIGFYDESDSLLGVWFFTENAALERGDKTHFTSHMRSLPIDGLVELAAKTKAVAFGIA